MVPLRTLAPLCLLVTLLAAPALAQSGKIAGRVTDAVTGESIPGASAIVVETGQGDAADLDGYYTILGVAPGRVAVRISAAGYASLLVENVDVNIDQTSTVDAQLQSADLGEVIVRAERPVVETDVSNSRANVSAEDIESLPVSSIGGVVGLQAGIEGDFLIRGSGRDEIAFQVNGLTLRDERNNAPYTNISISSIEEVQVQTGGFNAEYGNVRSGVVNVVTKEGDRRRYEASATVRYSPPSQKNIGPLANDPDSYWIRPFLDPEVAMVGTDAWDPITASQYPEFDGWIAISQRSLENDDPTDDITPEALQEAFLWQHRKSFDIVEPDYDVDLGVGGPLLPGLSRRLGDLRFYASYRREQDMYLLPLHTDRYTEQSGHLKLTSDIADGMKLSVEGRLGDADGTASSNNGAVNTGSASIFRSPFGIASSLSGVSFIDSRIFSTDYWGPSRTTFDQQAVSFTHAPSSRTFYEIRANRTASRYDTNPGRARDTTAVVTFGGVGFDEAPFGWSFDPATGVDGMRQGAGMSTGRDSSRVSVYNLRADLTSQLNRFMEVKTGLEYSQTRSETNYGLVTNLSSNNVLTRWDRSPRRGAAYGQTKLEFKGMIANLGLRLDYFRAGGDWYVYDPFEPAFGGAPTVGGDVRPALDSLLASEPTEGLWSLSPRLGVSFPVTSVSKLYVNYGHFRSQPDPDFIFRIRAGTTGGQVEDIGDPNNPLPKTVAYELGYEQAFLNQFLLRVAGYYKDVTLLPRTVRYVSRDGRVSYRRAEPNGYQDIRGFEVTVERNRGRWVQGFVNYTYDVGTGDRFGLSTVYQNPTDQRDLELANDEQLKFPGLARPFARANLDLLTPDDFGPSAGGLRPLADWRVSFIGRWRDGGKASWAGDAFGTRAIRRNVDVRDSWGLDLRFARTFDLGDRRVSLFADVFNVLNRKTVSSAGYFNSEDQRAYYRSLHFPESDDYPNVPGSDRVGDYREPGVAFEPICRVGTCPFGLENEDVLYYDRETAAYLAWNGSSFVPADPARVDRVLSTKAYIDMPNQAFLTFLGPRAVFLGLRLNL